MAFISLQNGSGKLSKIGKNAGNFEIDIEWQPSY